MNADLERIPFRILIDRVPDAARPHFRKLFLPAAVPLMGIGLLTIVFQSSMTARLFDQPDSLAALGGFLGAFVLLMIVLIAVYTLTFTALAVAATDAVYGLPVDLSRAWRFPLRPRVLVTVVAVAIVNAVSALMCLLPVLYVGPILAFVLPVMIVEGRTGFDAIHRSVEMAHFNPTGRWTDGAFLKILAFLFVGMTISYALSFTVQMPFAAVQQILVFRDAAAGSTDPVHLMTGMLWLQVPAQILTALATAASWLYWSFGLAMLYREIRRAKEGEDLDQAIGELTGEAAHDV
jgi:hypothetical protein